MIWCEHCRFHFPEDHYREDTGEHKAGTRYGIMGKGLAAIRVAEEAGLIIPEDMES